LFPPPQTIISVPVHTAVWSKRPEGAPALIKVVAQESAAGSQQAATSATRLAETATDLQALVSRFRLERPERDR